MNPPKVDNEHQRYIDEVLNDQDQAFSYIIGSATSILVKS